MRYDERFPPVYDNERVTPDDNFEQASLREALQVLTYSDQEKRRAAVLDGALTLEDLERLTPPRDRKLILYCA